MVLPNVLVIGAQRAGTTSLYNILSKHDEIYVPQRRKEIHYFDLQFERGGDWYQSFFQPAAAGDWRAIGEVTADYLFEPEVPGRIADLLPHCKLIAILRHPVARAFSGYLHHLRSFREQRDFAEFIGADDQTRARGFYALQLERYLTRFPRQQIHVMIAEELYRAPQATLDPLAQFLGLSRSWDQPERLLARAWNQGDVPAFQTGFYYARRVGELLTAAGLDHVVTRAKRLGVTRLFGRRRQIPEMPAATRRWLEELYAPDIAALEALLGRSIEIWRTPPAPSASVAAELHAPRQAL